MKRYFRRAGDREGIGKGAVWLEFDGDWATRQVELYDGRWHSSLEEYRPDGCEPRCRCDTPSSGRCRTASARRCAGEVAELPVPQVPLGLGLGFQGAIAGRTAPTWSRFNSAWRASPQAFPSGLPSPNFSLPGTSPLPSPHLHQRED